MQVIKIIICLSLFLCNKIVAQNYYKIPNREICKKEININKFIRSFTQNKKHLEYNVLTIQIKDTTYFFNNREKISKISIVHNCKYPERDSVYSPGDLPAGIIQITYKIIKSSKVDFNKLKKLPESHNLMVGFMLPFIKSGIYIIRVENIIKIYRNKSKRIHRKQKMESN